MLQHGGLAFLLMYFLVLLLVGAPVLLLEMFLGQYSGRTRILGGTGILR